MGKMHGVQGVFSNGDVFVPNTGLVLAERILSGALLILMMSTEPQKRASSWARGAFSTTSQRVFAYDVPRSAALQL